ncbi:schwannomin-interacting protein 1 homolog isoform X2 [Manduca sexta]|uniref:schwannomin-interacting protein 1 homolog isoform X2 n=1 Tax=Manduca sexta TaxID=7130 RepID=UPI00188E547B|nr:schwannomin-interacting protein 1 homolog isoform X2 [Manduca sexta]
MRITQEISNGNIAAFDKEATSSQRINTNWAISRNPSSNNLCENTNIAQFNTHCNNSISDSLKTSETIETYTFRADVENLETANVNIELSVCNRQYRINTLNNFVSCKSSTKESINLEDGKETLVPRESTLESPNVYSDDTPLDDERVFEHSDTDEMSENALRNVPRGIVNPNYPGFQHLAHTLQDYSSTIEQFYQSENDMTDDDADIEITDLAYEPDQYEISSEFKNINNNNTNNIKTDSTSTQIETAMLDSHNQNEIPDLLKTVTKNNNNGDSYFDLNCSDTDIENNFHTKDIIGDFNKEIEDEIRQLLNYNINIQDDLEELRKDIKDTFAKPIENTINNISEVVNHVIKKLVETQSDVCDEYENSILMEESSTNIKEKETAEEISKINKENEKNTRTEMNLSRPTFLLIDNNTSKITDAFLSDGKDEINISEYDTEKLSLNVENTIKQLSTELRKIIPKLDEMRERDRLWAESNRDTITILRDGNSNEIESSSKCYSFMRSVSAKDKADVRNVGYYGIHNTVRNNHTKLQSEPRGGRDCQKEVKNNYRSAQRNPSVRKNDIENTKDTEFDSFDVYNIETALPKLDLDAIENHLKAAKEAERRKRNDREEIRRRLAMGADADEYYSMGHTDRPGKKPSLHSRLQSASDNESQADLDKNVNYNTKNSSYSNIFSKTNYNHPYQTRPLSVNITRHDKISTVQSGAKLRPSSFIQKHTKSRSSHSLGHIELKESDFYALQATLQTEARIALAQAKEMARIQMERSRRARAVSPVTDMLRRSLHKAAAPLAADRRRVSRQLLTDMNIAQLQVIVNELHSQIESLNDTLVKLLMARDELHMGQDSMLVDIEDLTRYLGVKEQTKKTKGSKSGMKRLTSLVHK